jgi:hypothetical protein
MPKNAEKQIMPAITRRGYLRNTTPNGSLCVSLAASVESVSSGTVLTPMRCRMSSARWPWPCVASQRGDSGSEKRNTKTISAPMPIKIQMPRQPIESRKASVKRTPTGHGQAPPMNCMNAVMRPRMFFGAYSVVYEKHSGCSAPSPTPARKRPTMSQKKLGARAAPIVAMPNSSRLNW